MYAYSQQIAIITLRLKSQRKLCKLNCMSPKTNIRKHCFEQTALENNYDKVLFILNQEYQTIYTHLFPSHIFQFEIFRCIQTTTLGTKISCTQSEPSFTLS